MKSTEPEAVSPAERRDHTDPGDATGQNFRYQYAYGVVLLIAAARRELDYQAIWCEQQEDFLGEISSNLFDAYQVKTQQPEYGWWQHNSDAYAKSIWRFVQHEKTFPGKIRRYIFVSNTRPLNTQEKNKKYQSPVQLNQAVVAANDITEFDTETRRAFDYLIEQAELTRDDQEALFGVLRRLDFPTAPDRDAFLTTLSHEHLSKLEGCEQLNAQQLDEVAERLINLVASASSLGSQDPARHYYALNQGNAKIDPQLAHKRVSLDEFRAQCRDAAQSPVSFPAELSNKPLKVDVNRLERFRRKLKRGGLTDDEMESLRRQTIMAHGRFFELATRPDGENVVNAIENLVLDECTGAKLEASSEIAAPYGKQMYLKLRKQLQGIAKDQPHRVKRVEYEALMGMAGLLTEECIVWWSEQFDLSKDV